MSEDSPDLETIFALENRITAALDRIAGAAAVNAVAAQSADDGSAAAELQARVEALSEELTAATARAEGLSDELAAAQSGRQAAEDAQAALETELKATKDSLVAAETASADTDALAVAEEKANRLRGERDAIRAERDTLAEELDAFRSAASGEPAALVAAFRAMRQANADLRSANESLRQGAARGTAGADAIDAAMASEVLSLRAERAADAAEMQLILEELRPMTEGVGNA